MPRYAIFRYDAGTVALAAPPSAAYPTTIRVVDHTPLEYNLAILTVIESPLFTKLWPDYWTEEERGEFAAYIGGNPDAGDLIAGSGGCRTISPSVLRRIAEDMGHATK